MKTSNEIKSFVIEKLEEDCPMALYSEFLNQIEEKEGDFLHIKAVVSRWRIACGEAAKEKNLSGLSETFPQSLFCWNARIKAMESGEREKNYSAIKQGLGWDVTAVTKGKTCNVAYIIVNELLDNLIKKLNERLELLTKKD